jgi:hypothetical protein
MSKKKKIFEIAFLVIVLMGLFIFVIYPNFIWRPAKSKVSEPKSNLGAIRATQVAYFAEWKKWVGNQSPTPVADRRGNKQKVRWDTTTRFSIIGFAPEGGVNCSYALQGPDYPTAAEGFTARAECDFDGDGQMSIWTITNNKTEIIHSGAPF